MRLIDADAAKQLYIALINDEEVGNVRRLECLEFIRHIDNQPTAYEKQIPKMVVANGEIDSDDRWYGCPSCDEYLTGYWADDSILYCVNCGQRLDWEGVE